MKKSFFTLLLGLGVAFGANIQTLTQQCEANNAKACVDLGVAYANGTGVAKDLSKAFSFAKKACDMGWAQACYDVGNYYYYGTGVKKDINAAKNYSKKACSMGYQDGCKNYKIMLRQGGR